MGRIAYFPSTPQPQSSPAWQLPLEGGASFASEPPALEGNNGACTELPALDGTTGIPTEAPVLDDTHGSAAAPPTRDNSGDTDELLTKPPTFAGAAGDFPAEPPARNGIGGVPAEPPVHATTPAAP